VHLERIELARRALDSIVNRALTRQADGRVFAITGDIPAMWLRDSTAQMRPLLMLQEPDLVDLAIGVLRAQVDQVLLDPRANAFNPGPTGARGSSST
jgi:meiotically up-regulated gene 157 (Mug157) protein